MCGSPDLSEHLYGHEFQFSTGEIIYLYFIKDLFLEIYLDLLFGTYPPVSLVSSLTVLASVRWTKQLRFSV